MSDVVQYTGKEMNLEVFFQDETVWLSQAQMSSLFERDRDTISEHIQNTFKEKELEKDSVTRKFRATAADGKQYTTSFYNLVALALLIAESNLKQKDILVKLVVNFLHEEECLDS